MLARISLHKLYLILFLVNWKLLFLLQLKSVLSCDLSKLNAISQLSSCICFRYFMLMSFAFSFRDCMHVQQSIIMNDRDEEFLNKHWIDAILKNLLGRKIKLVAFLLGEKKLKNLKQRKQEVPLKQLQKLFAARKMHESADAFGSCFFAVSIFLPIFLFLPFHFLSS